MNNILYTLFEDNPRLSEEICKFCQSLPGYRQAEEDLERIAEELSRQLGRDAYDCVERTALTFFTLEERACYLFGLGLRQEVLCALEKTQ